jgi:hypothetical protein
MKVDSASEAPPQVKRRIIRDAVREENSRLEGTMKGRRSWDPVARTLQERMHMSAAVADRFAKNARAKREKAANTVGSLTGIPASVDRAFARSSNPSKAAQ